jgi:hypothetical protein
MNPMAIPLAVVRALAARPRARTPNPLVGRWTTGTVKGGRELTVDFEFSAGGRFVTTVRDDAGRALGSVGGSYAATEDTLTLTLPGGGTDEMPMWWAGPDEFRNGAETWKRAPAAAQ